MVIQGPRLVWRAPVLVTAVVLFLAQVAWTALNYHATVGPPILGNVPIYAGGLLTIWVYLRTARTPGIEPAGRRFWLWNAAGGVFSMLFMFGALPALAKDADAKPGAIIGAGYALGAVILIIALYRLPAVRTSGGERVRLGLDVATVLLSGIVVALYAELADVWDTPDTTMIATVTLVTGMAAVAMFGVVRVLLSGSRVVDTVALRLVALGYGAEFAGTAAQPLFNGHPVSTELLGRAAMELLLVLACLRQQHVGDGFAGRPRKPFSTLPYLAVAAIDILLCVALRDSRPAVVFVGASVVALTALVVVRQLAAFRENVRLLDELAMQEQRFRALVQNAADGIAICGADGTISYVSPGVELVTGRKPSDWPNRNEFAVLHPDDEPILAERFRVVATTPGTTAKLRARVAHAAGGYRWVEMSLSNQLHVPAVRGIVFNLSDITAVEQYHQELSHRASHDALTDLANRSLFAEQLERALAADVNAGTAGLSLALVDLDDFKSVNDTLGHQAGDALLIAVAERLRRAVRPQDLVARLGGDEFAVLLEDIAVDRVDGVADRLVACLSEPLRLAGEDISVRASIGIADARPGETADELVSHADLAMYQAKAAGKGQYVRYHDSIGTRDVSAARLGRELARALDESEFELHYQPIVALPHGDLAGVEALLRWRHPERGMIPPLDFIPQAEASGAIVPIGRWVLANACRQAAEWLRAYPDLAPATVNVNVSPRQLVELSFVDDVARALADSGLPPQRLTIEVTETAINDHVTAGAHLRAARALGVRVALDDFGTGQSTLSILDSVPIDQLKLDRSFIPSSGREAIAVAVARIAESLGTELVAEGIEEPGQADHLHSLGYGLAQGFHFSRPLPGEGITDLLACRQASAQTIS